MCAGFLIDLLIGDPKGWPHMVRGMGALIGALEKRLYKMKNKRAAGGVLAAVVLVCAAGLPAGLLCFAYGISPWAYTALEAFFCWQALSVKSLREESRPVYGALVHGDIEKSRRAVSMIIGRDTEALDEAGVARAAVETVAENTSDGVAAPIFYMALGGGALACAYKAVNTMDSMIGYKNERYTDFGRCAARMDDVMNYLPARVCAFFMIAAAGLCGLDAKGAARIWRRDRGKHASPNAAQTEAAAAGALGVRLAGDAYYFGRLYKKPFIGDNLRAIEPGDILKAHRLLYATAFLWMLAALLIRGCLYAAL
jgi:adenosylcobinamide-phosphate synthase